jgi:hypothetical protein
MDMPKPIVWNANPLPAKAQPPVIDEQKPVIAQIKSQRSTEIHFRLSKHVDGPFPGLWELAVMKPDGTVDEIISDADMLQYCLDNLHQVLENKGL